MKTIIFASIIAIFLFESCHTSENKTDNNVINLQETAEIVSIFGKDIVSTPLYERDIAISQKMDEIIYTIGDYKQNKRCLAIIRQINGNWTKPALLNISGKYQDIEPFFSYDAKKLYFASDRPIYGDSCRCDYNIWVSNRTEQGDWTTPTPLDSIINTRGDEFFPSISKNGNLYFTATRTNGIGREDIFRSELKENVYQSPEPLSNEINTIFYEFNAYISPDEDYIIFSSSGRDDEFGGGDLYMSKKDENGKWKNAINLGEQINSDKLDYCPFVDSRSLNFYFTSDRVGKQTEIKSLNDLIIYANRIENGFGNIYRINFNKLMQNK
jgi:Tol biopolymer transport system component